MTSSMDAPGIKLTCYEGPSGSGKTARLVERAVNLEKLGVDAQDVLFVVAQPNACGEVGARIREIGGSERLAARVTTARRLCIDILNGPEARAWSGRIPRVLDEFERGLLLEDLKAIPGKAARNREIVKFLLKEWTELGEDKEQFIISSEEQVIHDGMEERLALRGGMLSEELANIAVHYLRANEDDRVRFGAKHVLVDDCQNLCLASQRLCEELSRETLTVASCEAESCEIDDPYPYAAGAAGFAGRHEGACTIRLASPVRPPEVLAHEFVTPEEEVDSIAAEAAGRAAAGCSVLVVVPDAWYGRETAISIGALGIEASMLEQGGIRPVDPCDRQAATLLRLACDPSDGVAWRTWFALRDGLLGCGEWRELEEHAARMGMTAAEALACLDRHDPADLEGIPHACLLTRGYREAVEKAREVAAAEHLPEAAGQAPARGMVAIGGQAAVAGLRADVVFVAGAVEGHYPSCQAIDPEETVDHRAYFAQRDRRLFLAGLGCARREVRISLPLRDEADRAEREGLGIRRIYLLGGVRTALLEPSPFLQTCGSGD